MSRFSLIRPLDQPLGNHRLLDDLKVALQDSRFTDFRLIVAYARSGPLYRLQGLMEAWREHGKTSAAIVGIDQQGTSKDALDLALSLFDCVYVTREAGITFHPKMYLFTGERHAQAFAVKVLGLGTNKSPQPEDASQWLMARGGVSAARWLFGLPRFVARWRPRPERVVFQTVAAVACRHRRTATQWRAIFSSSGVDGHAPTMSVCRVQQSDGGWH